MYKSTLAALALCLTSGVAVADPFTVNRTLTCDTLKAVIDLLAQYGEKVAWQSSSDKGLTNILTTNRETQTWTIVITNGQSACLVDSGKGYTMKQDTQREPSKGSLNRIVM